MSAVPANRRFIAEFGLGETVYHRLWEERRPGIITGILFYISGAEIYVVAWGDCSDTRHYAQELTRDCSPDFGAM